VPTRRATTEAGPSTNVRRPNCRSRRKPREEVVTLRDDCRRTQACQDPGREACSRPRAVAAGDLTKREADLHLARGPASTSQPAPGGGRQATQPPSAYGTFLGHHEDGTVGRLLGGRKMRSPAPRADRDHPPAGPGGRLNTRVAQRGAGPRAVRPRGGSHLQEMLDDGCGQSSSDGPTRSGSWRWPRR